VIFSRSAVWRSFSRYRSKRGLLQNLAFRSKDPILLAQACELLAGILMGTLEQIRLLVLGAQPTQRRFRNAEIICNPLNAGPAGHRHGLAFELIRETPLFVPAHSHLLYRS